VKQENAWGKSEAELQKLAIADQGMIFQVSKVGECFKKCDILRKWPAGKRKSLRVEVQKAMGC